MKLFKIINGYLKENAYLIGEDKCYIIDPGKDSELIINKINKEFDGVNAILLTHGHFDHCGCVDELVDKYHCDVYMNDNDIMQIDGSLVGHYKLKNMVAVLKTKTIDPIHLNDSDIKVYETPGHTDGGVCYHFVKENIIFTGDTLFFEGIGRFDLPGGNKTKLSNSLQFLFNLNENLDVYPGHDQKTTIKHEKDFNPFI